MRQQLTKVSGLVSRRPSAAAYLEVKIVHGEKCGARTEAHEREGQTKMRCGRHGLTKRVKKRKGMTTVIAAPDAHLPKHDL